jgi:CHAT domain-containing protein
MVAEQNEGEYGISIVNYAVALGEKYNLPDLVKAQLYLSQFINYTREGRKPQDSISIEKAWTYCNGVSTRYCRKIKAYQLQARKINKLSDIHQETLDYMFTHDEKSIESDRSLYTHLGYMMEDAKEKKFFFDKKKKLEGDDICGLGFWSYYYEMNDAYNAQDHIKMKSFLDKFDNQCNLEGITNQFLLNRQKYRAYHLLFIKTENINYLDSARTEVLKTLKYTKERFKRDNTLHYSDFIYDVYMDYLDILVKMQTQSINVKNSIIEQQYIGKKFFSKSIDLLAPEIMEAESNRYLKCIFEIDKNNLILSDLQFKDLEKMYSVTKNLYELHTLKYQLERNQISNIQSHKPLTSSSDMISKLLKNNAQYIDISYKNSNAFATIINPDTIYVKKITLSTSFDEEIDTWLESITKKDKVNQPDLDWIIDLVNPKFKNVIFCLDGKLKLAPLEAIQLKNGSYLIEKYIVQYVNNIDELRNDEKINISKTKIHVCSYTDSKTLSNSEESNYSELPFGLKESKYIQQFFPEQTILYEGKNFRSKDFKAFKGLGILHLSTHSYSNERQMLNNYIVARNQKGKADKIYGFEIKARPTVAKVVILSSCKSGVGKSETGAGNFSLSRDFLASGSQTVIKSLWSVNDQSTSEIMKLFYKSLSEGQDLTSALAYSKKMMVKSEQLKHPYYWSGFVLEGNGFLKI